MLLSEVYLTCLNFKKYLTNILHSLAHLNKNYNRSLQVKIGLVCLAAAGLIFCVQSLYKQPAVLFSFILHTSSEPNPSRLKPELHYSSPYRSPAVSVLADVTLNYLPA